MNGLSYKLKSPAIVTFLGRTSKCLASQNKLSPINKASVINYQGQRSKDSKKLTIHHDQKQNALTKMPQQRC